LKADLFEALHEHTRKHALHLAGELPKSPDMIVLGAATATAASDGDGDGDGDRRAGARTWYPIDGQDRKKATIKEIGIGDGDTVAWMCRDGEFDVQEMEVVDDCMGAE
jgi:hypothetical protein